MYAENVVHGYVDGHHQDKLVAFVTGCREYFVTVVTSGKVAAHLGDGAVLAYLHDGVVLPCQCVQNLAVYARVVV